MVFSSFIFLCLFFPVVLLAYYLVPKGYKNLLLLVASLIFYGWGEPRYILIMVFSTVFDYTNGRLLGKFDADEKIRKKILLVSILGNLSILCFFKYTDFVLGTINQLTDAGIGLLRLALPIGISFYTFQTMSYTIDVYRRRVEIQNNLIDFAMYVCLFPQLIAGPIVRYADISHEIKDRTVDLDLFAHGMKRFIMGLGKKVLLANQAGALFKELSVLGGYSVCSAWIMSFAFFFQIYFDFSGYSDMAIGMGEMFGFHFPENFAHPYESKSITEFFRRWHMTLGTWFREYVYIPLGGNRRGLGRQLVNLLIVWALTGIWHGAGFNFIMWGLYCALILIMEKVFLLRILEKVPGFIRHIYTVVLVNIGWIFFAELSFAVRGRQLLSMLGFGRGFMDPVSLFCIRSYGILLLICAVGSTSFPRKAFEAIVKNEDLRQLLSIMGCLGVFLLSICFLVGDSYNPFLYFRF